MSTKRKAEADVPSSWRAKCIEQFNLQPVPEHWNGSVAAGSESAWKQYFEYRSREEEISSEYDHDDGSECYGKFDLMEEWKKKMWWTKSCRKWLSWTPKFGRLVFEDADELRTGEYFSHIWSPYAIPHALGLRHDYNRRVRWSSIEFSTTWSYRFIDFEAYNPTESEYKELCSNFYRNQELRADVIDTSNLNIETVNELRRFVFGSDSEDSKKLICPDDTFIRILFGSMGTVDPDLESDMRSGCLGYSWTIDDEVRKMLFEAKAPEDDDPEGDPPESFDDYYPNGCSWLMYRVLEITGTLGPISRHYKHPTIKDASGYYEHGSDEDDNDDEYKDMYEAVRRSISNEQARGMFETLYNDLNNDPSRRDARGLLVAVISELNPQTDPTNT